MKRWGILAVVAALGAGFFFASDRAPKPDERTQRETKVRPRTPGGRAFWEKAEVPDAERPPVSELVLVDSVPTKDFPAKIDRLSQSGETDLLNFTLAAWFGENPVAVRDWLATRDSLEPYQPALSMIATKICGAGDPETALAWANLLSPGPERDRLLFDIYALAARENRLPEDRLKSAPLPPERIDLLLGGAAGD